MLAGNIHVLGVFATVLVSTFCGRTRAENGLYTVILVYHVYRTFTNDVKHLGEGGGVPKLTPIVSHNTTRKEILHKGKGGGEIAKNGLTSFVKVPFEYHVLNIARKAPALHVIFWAGVH